MRTACKSIFRSVFITQSVHRTLPATHWNKRVVRLLSQKVAYSCELLANLYFVQCYTQSVHLNLPATHWNKRVVRLLSQTQISIFVRSACESIFRSPHAFGDSLKPQSVCVRSLPFIANTFENNSIRNFTYCEPQRPGRSSKAILKALLGSGVSNTRYAVGIKIDTVSVQTMICVNNTDISSDTQPDI